MDAITGSTAPPYPWCTIVVGGGIGGLTAAIYLARFHRSCLVVDSGLSRAEQIPVSHNASGWRCGIHGRALLATLREQATSYGAQLLLGDRVTAARRLSKDEATEVVRRSSGDGGGANSSTGRAGDDEADDEPNSAAASASDSGEESRPPPVEHRLFEVKTASGATLYARTLLIATGVVDLMPAVPRLADAVRTSVLRICAVCDAWEIAPAHRVAIIARGGGGVAEARFLRTYSQHLTYFQVAEGSGNGNGKAKGEGASGHRALAVSGEERIETVATGAGTTLLGHGVSDVSGPSPAANSPDGASGGDSSGDSKPKPKPKSPSSAAAGCYKPLDDEARRTLASLRVAVVDSPVTDIELVPVDKVPPEMRPRASVPDADHARGEANTHPQAASAGGPPVDSEDSGGGRRADSERASSNRPDHEPARGDCGSTGPAAAAPSHASKNFEAQAKPARKGPQPGPCSTRHPNASDGSNSAGSAGGMGTEPEAVPVIVAVGGCQHGLASDADRESDDGHAKAKDEDNQRGGNDVAKRHNDDRKDSDSKATADAATTAEACAYHCAKEGRHDSETGSERAASDSDSASGSDPDSDSDSDLDWDSHSHKRVQRQQQRARMGIGTGAGSAAQRPEVDNGKLHGSATRPQARAATTGGGASGAQTKSQPQLTADTGSHAEGDHRYAEQRDHAHDGRDGRDDGVAGESESASATASDTSSAASASVHDAAAAVEATAAALPALVEAGTGRVQRTASGSVDEAALAAAMLGEAAASVMAQAQALTKAQSAMQAQHDEASASASTSASPNIDVPPATLEALRSSGIAQLRAFSPRSATAVAAGSVNAGKAGGCAPDEDEGEKHDGSPSRHDDGSTVPSCPAGMRRPVLVTRADASSRAAPGPIGDQPGGPARSHDHGHRRDGDGHGGDARDEAPAPYGEDPSAIGRLCVLVHTADGGCHYFDTAYSVLGTVARSQLAAQLGCRTSPHDGRLTAVDAKRATDVEGVYAAGDVVVSGSGTARADFHAHALSRLSCAPCFWLRRCLGVEARCPFFLPAHSAPAAALLPRSTLCSRCYALPLGVNLQDGLNQLAVAMGDAAIAATSINKLLCCEGHVVRAEDYQGRHAVEK